MRQGPTDFSWFVSRGTNPTTRNMLMQPRNPIRAEEALISLLAGDICGCTPIWCSICIPKAIYYLQSLASPRISLEAKRRREFNITVDGANAFSGQH